MIEPDEIEVVVAGEDHVRYVDEILDTITRAAKVRGTGIAKRSPEYVKQKMLEHKAVVALYHGRFAMRIKRRIFSLSREMFPSAKIFSLTTGAAVMKMNNELGYRPVTFSQLTEDEAFWKGCESCVNFDILQRNGRRMCLCTGMLYDPEEHKENNNIDKPDNK